MAFYMGVYTSKLSIFSTLLSFVSSKVMTAASSVAGGIICVIFRIFMSSFM
jgi:hypothetical protein